MIEENWIEVVHKAKNEYRKIGYIECPAFGGERVYFRSRGFTHLIRKGREPRTLGQQRRRVGLFKYVVDILVTCTAFDSCRKTNKYILTKNGLVESSAQFWSFKKYINGKNIFIVVCRFGIEPMQFLSVIDDLPDIES